MRKFQFLLVTAICFTLMGMGCDTKKKNPTGPGDDTTELFRWSYVGNGMFMLDFYMPAEYFPCTDGAPSVAGFNGDWTPVQLTAIGDDWYSMTLSLNQGHHQFTPLFGTSCWMKGDAMFLENGRWFCGGGSFEGDVAGEEMKPCGG